MDDNIRPINRNQKFFSDSEFEFQLEMGMEYMESIRPSSIIVYKVNLENTEIDDVYGESYSDEVTLDPPIEIPAIVKLEQTESKTYNENGSLFYEEHGNLVVSIMLKHLKELNLTINYGDYIGYRVREDLVLYFEVSKPSNKHFENKNTFGGYMSYYKTIFAHPVNLKEEFFTG